MNYRHQADACHAYQLMLQSGVPADNIILMMQDDVANSSENPFPGQLFNKPGENPPDVYKGCKVDYSGDIVTGKLFMDVLTGNTEGAKGKVLKSGASDTVFVNFVDHGGPGIVAFPNGPVLTVKELSQTLKTMQSKQMFKQMVFYMEACESGSMFPDLKDDDLGKFKSESFRSQISKVTKLTDKSHVCSFGDKSFEDEKIGSVETTSLSVSPSDAAQGAVDARDIYVTQAMWAWQHAADWESKQKAWKRLVGIMKDQEADEKKILSERMEMTHMDCHHELAHAVHEKCPASEYHNSAGGWNGFNMKFAR
ncbi:Lgmn, partial [Symbiodinium microadriaticum]